jgi:hypothetical protein
LLLALFGQPSFWAFAHLLVEMPFQCPHGHATVLCQRRGTPSCLLGQLRPVLDMFQFGVRTGSFNTMFILRWE